MKSFIAVTISLIAALASLAELQPLSLEGARERFGRRISDEDLLLRLTMPAEQVDAMVAARDGGSPPPLAAARPGRCTAARPPVTARSWRSSPAAAGRQGCSHVGGGESSW